MSIAKGEAIAPAVLVGGASKRFGRNKLLEPVGDGVMLVDRPIAALREIFGVRVTLIGQCDPALAARADLHIPDVWPGAGPAGGIASALEHFGCSIFVLAGDMPSITAEAVRNVLACAEQFPDAVAALGHTGQYEPCVGVYRKAALDPLRRSLEEGHSGSVVSRLSGFHIAATAVDAREVANANTAAELHRALEGHAP